MNAVTVLFNNNRTAKAVTAPITHNRRYCEPKSRKPIYDTNITAAGGWVLQIRVLRSDENMIQESQRVRDHKVHASMHAYIFHIWNIIITAAIAPTILSSAADWHVHVAGG